METVKATNVSDNEAFSIENDAHNNAVESISTNFSDRLDLNSILKVSQILSEEAVLSRLLKKIMHVVIENVGAEKGFLLLPQQDTWFIRAQGHIDNSDTAVLQSLSLKETDQVPAEIVYYVARARKNLVLDDASQERLFARVPYIIKYRPKSVLCVPLVNQRQLIGILYLENNLTDKAFTPERIEVLNLLSSQIVVSIKNSLLMAERAQTSEVLKTSEV
jgi:GAF domain-containing protein